MFKSKHAYLRVLIGGTLLALLVIILARVFLSSEQCPADATTEVIDAGGCVVGANIGLGLAYFAAVIIEVASIAVAIGLFIAKRRSS